MCTFVYVCVCGSLVAVCPIARGLGTDFYEGKTQPLDLITSEQSNLLSNMVLDKSPEAISRFRLMSGGLKQGMSFGSMMALQ